MVYLILWIQKFSDEKFITYKIGVFHFHKYLGCVFLNLLLCNLLLCTTVFCTSRHGSFVFIIMENNWNICKHKLDIYQFKVKHYPFQGSNSKKTFHQSSFFSWTVHPTLAFCNLLVCATRAMTEIDFLSVGRSCLTLAPTLLFCNLLLQLHAKPTKTDFPTLSSVHGTSWLWKVASFLWQCSISLEWGEIWVWVDFIFVASIFGVCSACQLLLVKITNTARRV